MIITIHGKTPRVAPSAFVAENAVLIGNVTIGENASVWYGAVLRGDNAPIVIGENANIQDNCTLHCDAGVPLTVGKNVTVGHNVILHSCTVEEGSLIGMGSVVMNRSVIGPRCLVGAGSLITEGKQFEGESLILGSPARQKSRLDSAALEGLQESAAGYVNRAALYRESAKKLQ